ncbi:MAG: hypothetical protein IPN36_12595 [Bacteroidetes bacterium]|nr:hypothetical protein [Bacteroidota bacterium]
MKCHRLKIKSQYPQDALSNIRGYVDSLGNRPYALVGFEVRFSIVNVTDPANPV